MMSPIKKILVIEDEAAQVLYLTTHLQKNGYQAASAFSAEEGLKKIAADRPDAILADIILPGMTGLELCQKLKASPDTRDIPMILVTASGMKELGERSKVFGADAVVLKPYQISDVLDKLRQFTEKKSAA